MTEEVKTEINPEIKEEPQISEIEQEAMAHGWRPKEEFDESSGKKWRTAEEFMDRKPLFDKIDEQHRRLKTLEQGLNALAQHNKKIEETAYVRALNELKKERKLALEEGDLVKAEEIRDRIDEVKEQAQTEPAPQPQGDPRFEAWVEKNKWYTSDPMLKKFADGVAFDLRGQGVKDPDEFLNSIEREVRTTFPQKFRNPNKDLAPGMESGRGKVKSDGFSLTVDEDRMINQMIKAGAPITREEYIAQIKAQRGVK